MSLLDEMGLVYDKDTKKLLYGYKHGYLIDYPDWIKDTIVKVWNNVACAIYGHNFYNPKERNVDYKLVCVSCCKKWKDP